MIVILDCYTDEPAGLGVPPYLGTYARYIAGSLKETPIYITIDDLRKLNKEKPKRKEQKTDIHTYNLTNNFPKLKEILEKTTELIIIAGIHTPGKYLSAVPGTLKEIIKLTKHLNCKKILTGPAVYGTSAEGGKFFEKADLSNFNEIKDYNFSYADIKKYAVKGASILKQIPDRRIIELETSRGCSRAEHCSFCTEPLKNRISFRDKKDIIEEAKTYKEKYFRLGKQSCFYSHPQAIEILEGISKLKPKLLHIDNVNPANVVTKKGIEITKAILKYCTEGNIAAFGVESFDPEVIKQNNLNSDPETTYKAVKILNKYGAEKGPNGMPTFLTRNNLLFGHIGETKETKEHNLKWLKKMLNEGLLIRRINVRQVDIFQGTPLHNTVGNKFIKKNKKYYWKWRNQIRQQIDLPMLKKLTPQGSILKDLYTEIHDGKTTFARQLGTYPLIVGIKEKLPLKKKINIKVKSHMLRSLVGEIT